jgi:hypothetical protein
MNEVDINPLRGFSICAYALDILASLVRYAALRQVLEIGKEGER